MRPIEREEMKRRSQAKLEAMRERVRQLRYRVLTGAAIGFLALWAAIFAQMITGHDPALGPATAAVRTTTKGDATHESEPGFTAEGQATGNGDNQDENDDEEEGGAPIPVEEAVEEEAIEEAAEEAEELEPATTGQS